MSHPGTLETMAADLRARKISSRELVEQSLLKIARLDVELNAFLTVDAAGAAEAATVLDEELARGVDRGPLHGIPIAHKDLMRTAGIRTTAGAKILDDYVPTRDAHVVSLLKQAGAITLGKTGLHEFAYGITSNNPHFGAVHNPWNLECSPGGSSGGSAAAVAAGIVPLATGTDTGGSIRIPASFCGVVGLKPTFGRVSTRGVFALGPTQDHVGPITGTVRDAAIALNAMVDIIGGYVPPIGVSIEKIRIGWPQKFFFDKVDEEVRSAVLATRKSADEMRAEIIDVQVPDMEAVRWAAFTTLLSEAAAVLRKHFTTRKSDLGHDIQAYVEQGLAIPAVDYIEAQRIRRKARHEFNRIFEDVDCIFTPTAPITAPKIGQDVVKINGVDEEVRPAATRFTRGMNALGFPAISIPCGFNEEGLPIGLQVIAGFHQEEKLLRIAAAMEDGLGLQDRRPALAV